jgi:hypothetical protein
MPEKRRQITDANLHATGYQDDSMRLVTGKFEPLGAQTQYPVKLPARRSSSISASLEFAPSYPLHPTALAAPAGAF